MKKIQVNGVTLAYEELGIGDNVVIASQNRFSPNYWARLLAQPPYHYHVYLLVMRGYAHLQPRASGLHQAVERGCNRLCPSPGDREVFLHRPFPRQLSWLVYVLPQAGGTTRFCEL